jgi:hypothetical protein
MTAVRADDRGVLLGGDPGTQLVDAHHGQPGHVAGAAVACDDRVGRLLLTGEPLLVAADPSRWVLLELPVLRRVVDGLAEHPHVRQQVVGARSCETLQVVRRARPLCFGDQARGPRVAQL